MRKIEELEAIKAELLQKLDRLAEHKANKVFTTRFVNKKITETREEIRKVTKRLWAVRNKEKINERMRIARAINPQKYRDIQRNWRSKSPTRKQYERKYHYNLRNNSVTKYWENVLRIYTRDFYFQKTSRSTVKKELFGCTRDEFKAHIRANWESWMSDDNYGRVRGDGKLIWNFHHVKPLSSFDLSDPEQRKLASHYTNIRPILGVLNTQLGRKK